MKIKEFVLTELNTIANKEVQEYLKKAAWRVNSYIINALKEQNHLQYPDFKGIDYDYETHEWKHDVVIPFSKLSYSGQEAYINEIDGTEEIFLCLKNKIQEFLDILNKEIKEEKKEKLYKQKWADSQERCVKSFARLNPADNKYIGNHMIFKGYKVSLYETANYDWDYYAKSYGHPKKTVECREVLFYKKGKTQRINISSFRTTDVIKGIADFFKIPLATQNRLQTSRYFEITKIKDTAKYAVYTQTFGGVIVGYVVSDGKITYHDDTKKAAIEGWKKKAALAQEKKEIKAGLRFTAAQLHENYGFCWAGIHEFADACGLDTTKSYTQKELRTAFNKSPERRTLLIKYKSELSQIL